MKNIIITVGLLFTVYGVNADSKSDQKPPQHSIRNEILIKYDTNKDGKLDESERSQITPEDKKKIRTGKRRPQKGSGGHPPRQ